MTCSELLDQIRAKPGMFLGYRSVTRLRFFLAGYMHACSGATDTERFAEELSDFTQWLAVRFRVTTSHDWSGIVLFMAQDSEESGYKNFWELWDEFRSLRR